MVSSASAESKITAVMNSPLRILDPIITTTHITRNHGYMIYDVLIAQDANLQPRPQMADWTVSDDKTTYTFVLRDGLKFHDKTPVTAADAVASLKRWAEKDSAGQLIMDRTKRLETVDERTFVWELNAPFVPMLDVLSKQSTLVPFIMPARVAATPANEAITDYTGSGPFIFVADEFKPGIGATYIKNPDYVPRSEPTDGMAGGKNVSIDRVRWVTMPDHQTAANALLAGEVDYVEQYQVDLLPLLDGAKDIAVEVREPTGMQTLARLNFLHPPFNDKKVRQAALKAISVEPVLAAMIGDPQYYRICGAVLGCGTPLGSEEGAGTLVTGGGVEEARKMLKESGYDGTPVVVMAPNLAAQPVVVAQLLREAGFTVDVQGMDWQTMYTRRASQAAPADGGWNLFVTNFMVSEMATPISNPLLNGRGKDAWFGWPTDARIEELKLEYVAAKDLAEQKQVAEKIQLHTLDNVLVIPLGQYIQPQARSNRISEMLPTAIPVFWGMKLAD